MRGRGAHVQHTADHPGVGLLPGPHAPFNSSQRVIVPAAAQSKAAGPIIPPPHRGQMGRQRPLPGQQPLLWLTLQVKWLSGWDLSCCLLAASTCHWGPAFWSPPVPPRGLTGSGSGSRRRDFLLCQAASCFCVSAERERPLCFLGSLGTLCPGTQRVAGRVPRASAASVAALGGSDLKYPGRAVPAGPQSLPSCVGCGAEGPGRAMTLRQHRA